MIRFKRFFSVVVLMCLVAVTLVSPAQVQAKSNDNVKWIKACVYCKQYVRDKNFTYDNNYLKQIPLNKNKDKKVDCSSYVSWALYEYGFKDLKGKQWTSTDFKKLFTSKKSYRKSQLQRITGVKSFSKLKMGDILVYSGHVEVYVCQSSKKGYPTVYSCGSNSQIKCKSLLCTSSHKISSLVGVIRVK